MKNNEAVMHETERITEKVVLAAVVGDGEDLLNELEELVKTAGACVTGKLTQKREGIHPNYYLGKGKLDELKALISETGATGVVCDDELTPSQLRHMEEMLDTKIMDRTMIILDIFARRANSAEGKVQVELAQLKYRLSHLSGLGKSMSRLGGGIGTRGPGEKKLETDRRHIRNRIAELNSELKEISQHRNVLREKRERKNMPVISMVGYTNAGKSTLLNYLTNAGVLAEDKLFATLDTITKKIILPNGSEALFTDTVGFIRKLPHHLINSFRATLEELNYADILIHVVDASNPERDQQMEVVVKTLSDLGLNEKPVILAYNKIDKDCLTPPVLDKLSTKIVEVSAFTGAGVENLLTAIEDILKSFRKEMKILIPYAEGGLLSKIHGSCDIIEEQHTEEGCLIRAFMTEEAEKRFEKYAVK